MDPESLDLRDVHLPEPPPWWPPAPGWWLLFALVLLAGLAAWLYWQRYRAERPRRMALAELDAVARRCADEPQRLASELSIWLRRVALTLQPRIDVAGLTGQDWLDALQRLSPGSTLVRDCQQLLLQGPYAPVSASGEELEGVLEACRDWTRKLEVSR
jgi:hypothetical protein